MKANERQVHLRDRGRHPAEGRRDLLHDRRQDRPRRSRRRSRRRPAPSSRSAPAPPGAAYRPPTPTRRAPPARPRSSRARRWSRCRAARRTPTSSSAPRCSTRPSARCPRSTTRPGRCSPTVAPSTSTARAGAHFDAGRFVQQFGDEGHRQGWCLYKTRLQGPGHPRQLLDPALRRGRGRLADRPRAPLLRLHRAVAGVPHAAARHRHDRAAHAARHLPPDPRRAGEGRRDRDRPRRPRGGGRPRRRLPVREEAGRRALRPAAAGRERGGRREPRPSAGAARARRDGRGHRAVAAAPAHAARAARAVPSRSDGHALRHHDVHRLQGLRRGLPRGERPRARPRSRRPAPGPARPERPDQERDQALQGGRQDLLHEVAVHALRGSRPAPPPACCTRCRRTRRPAIVGYDPTYCVGCRYCQMACPFNVAEVRVREGGAEDREVRAVPAPRRRREARRPRRVQPVHAGPRARLLRGLPARGGHLRHA